MAAPKKYSVQAADGRYVNAGGSLTKKAADAAVVGFAEAKEIAKKINEGKADLKAKPVEPAAEAVAKADKAAAAKAKAEAKANGDALKAVNPNGAAAKVNKTPKAKASAEA